MVGVVLQVHIAGKGAKLGMEYVVSEKDIVVDMRSVSIGIGVMLIEAITLDSSASIRVANVR